MKITKENDELVLRLPLSQDSFDAIGEKQGTAPTLIGVIAGNEYTISHLIDLGYKGDQQEGMPILHFEREEDLRDVCKQFGLSIWEHEICTKCKKVIYGSFTWGTNGVECNYH